MYEGTPLGAEYFHDWKNDTMRTRLIRHDVGDPSSARKLTQNRRRSPSRRCLSGHWALENGGAFLARLWCCGPVLISLRPGLFPLIILVNPTRYGALFLIAPTNVPRAVTN